MSHTKLKWDGSDIGHIDLLIIGVTSFRDKLIYHFFDGSMGFITLYKDKICIIADELKILFGLEKIGRHVCMYKNIKYILHRKIYEEYILKESPHMYNLDDIKKIYIYRWVLGLVSNFDSTLLLRKYYNGSISSGNNNNNGSIIRITSSGSENTYNYMKHTKYGSDIGNGVIKRWFGTRDKYVEYCDNFFNNKSFLQMKNEITSIISRIDETHNLWIFSMCIRLSRYLKK